MKKIKYTPDAADKLRALKMAISQEYGSDSAKKIIKSITDAIRGLCDYEEKGPEVSKMFDVASDYRYIFLLVIFAIVWSFSFGLNGISILCKVGVYD